MPPGRGAGAEAGPEAGLVAEADGLVAGDEFVASGVPAELVPEGAPGAGEEAAGAGEVAGGVGTATLQAARTSAAGASISTVARAGRLRHARAFCALCRKFWLRTTAKKLLPHAERCA